MPGIFHAQDMVGEISFKKEVRLNDKPFEDLKKTDPETFKRFQSFTRQLVEAQKQVDYTLQFKDGTSNYYAEDILGKEKELATKVRSMTGLFYNNIHTVDRFQELEVAGRTFIIKREPMDWEIIGETRIISGYVCRKAVSRQTLQSPRSGKSTVVETVAWFAPEIPLPFGPEGYGGLPGLILELSVDRDHFYATSITLEEKDIQIRRPTKGEVVTEEEYLGIMAGLNDKYKSYHGIE